MQPGALIPILAAGVVAVAVSGCGRGSTRLRADQQVRTGVISAVGAESQYANVISQIGGRYVSVSAIMSDPNTDPHSFEASPGVAQTISTAKLIVQNGLGYDPFMNRLEAASPNATRRVISVQRLLRLPDSTRNPHLWYSPRIVAIVATAVARDLASLQPRHARYFRQQLKRFNRSLDAVYRTLASLRSRFAATPVSSSEPVANYLLQAAGTRNLTTWTLQADIMNGVDPAPQDLTAEDNLLQARRVKAFVYNRQVTDTVTQSFLQQALQHNIPVVAVYETMPQGYSYQSWMLAELHALQRAIGSGRSTRSL